MTWSRPRGAADGHGASRQRKARRWTSSSLRRRGPDVIGHTDGWSSPPWVTDVVVGCERRSRTDIRSGCRRDRASASRTSSSSCSSSCACSPSCACSSSRACTLHPARAPARAGAGRRHLHGCGSTWLRRELRDRHRQTVRHREQEQEDERARTSTRTGRHRGGLSTRTSTSLRSAGETSDPIANQCTVRGPARRQSLTSRRHIHRHAFPQRQSTLRRGREPPGRTWRGRPASGPPPPRTVRSATRSSVSVAPAWGRSAGRGSLLLPAAGSPAHGVPRTARAAPASGRRRHAPPGPVPSRPCS